MASRRKSNSRTGKSNRETSQSDQQSSSAKSFPVVGVGASAGGLEAFTELLKHLPPDNGLGFVLVQHLDPQHTSSLSQILSRATSIPVREVTNNLRIEPNQVYVIPPNTNLIIAQGVLKLHPRKPTHAPTHSIDLFFESLAQDKQEQAIGVILSGTATDGTAGLEAIKGEGGITFAQDDSARYASMPRNAEAAGCVDAVLSPRDIARELARIVKHPYVAGGPVVGGARRPRHPVPQAPRAGENGYRKILLLLRNHSGVDFSRYKSTTLHRRIQRRMLLNKKDSPEQYANWLRNNPKELEALYSDALINVTSFFRNADAFEVLQRNVLSKMFGQRGNEPVRVWVPGCSTGQEPYSIAMAFQELAEKAPRPRKLQMFATDLNDAMLDKARHGLYARSIAQDVAPARLRRFFVEEEGGYRVVKSLREMVVFARQNLIGDPPFSRLDLISCRNLLIYLEPGLQRKMVPTFHYALKPEGFLFLGASESVGGLTDLFEQADRKHRIYSRKPTPTLDFRLPSKWEQRTPPPAPPVKSRKVDVPAELRGELTAEREADRVTVKQFAPPGVLINGELQILQFRGATGAYLEPPTGKASFDVLKMAREGLMLPLRTAIHKAKKENKTVRKENVLVRQNGKARAVNLEVIPLKNLREQCFLILFEEAVGRDRPPVASPAARPAARRESPGEVKQLEAELAGLRDYHQSMQEQHEAANEELQASNEEVQSANEELQSLNEELETSKEELESANEELITLNEELVNRNTELKRSEQIIAAARDYAEAVVRTVPNPLVVLDADLRVDTASEAFYSTFKVSPAESEGRLIYELGNQQWNIPKLRELLEDILPGRSDFKHYEVTHNFETIGQRTMLVNARKLESAEGQPGRILLGLHDITEAKLLLQRRRMEAEIARAVEAEHLRLGQELHDGLGQELTGIGMLLDALAEKLMKSAPKHAGEARKLRRRLAAATGSTRSLAKSFYPVEIEKHGLLVVLREFARFTESSFPISCVVEADANVPLLKDARAIQLFRIAREAIHNAAKHAQAKHIHVCLATQAGEWMLAVKDDGVGLRRDRRQPEGMGLRIMQYRAQMIGGTLSVRNNDEGGVIVSCAAPAIQPVAEES